MPWSNVTKPNQLSTADSGNRVVIDGSTGSGKIDFWTGMDGEKPSELAALHNSGGPVLALTAGSDPGQPAGIASFNLSNTVATMFSGTYPTANQLQVRPDGVRSFGSSPMTYQNNSGFPVQTYLTDADRWTGAPTATPNTTNGSAVIPHGLLYIPSAITCQLVQPASGAPTGGTNPVTVLLLNLATWTAQSFNVQLFTLTGPYTGGATQRFSVICHK